MKRMGFFAGHTLKGTRGARRRHSLDYGNDALRKKTPFHVSIFAKQTTRCNASESAVGLLRPRYRSA